MIQTPIGFFHDKNDLQKKMKEALGIPTRFQDAPPWSEGQARILDAIKNYAENGSGVYLYGIPGSGKTTLASSAFFELALWYKGGVWVSHLDLIDSVRNNLDGDDLMRAIRAPVLLLDDFGALKPTEWAQERTFKLISKRYNDKAPTIITSNFAPDTLKDGWGAPTISRLKEMCHPIEMPRVDFRKRNGAL